MFGTALHLCDYSTGVHHAALVLLAYAFRLLHHLELVELLIVVHGLNDLEVNALKILDSLDHIIKFIIELLLALHVDLELVHIFLRLIILSFTELDQV